MTAAVTLVLSLAACVAGDDSASNKNVAEDKTTVIAQVKNTQTAVAYRGCTQEDAPALMIRLENVGQSQATVEIELAGMEKVSWPMTIVLSPLRRKNVGERTFGRAVYLAGKDPYFLEGEIEITALETDRHIKGSYSLTLPDGVHVAAAFSANWRVGAVACGG